VSAGNTSNLKHGGEIASKKCQQLENIFQQFIEISLTTSQTPYFQAFPSITSKAKISRPQGNFQPIGQLNRQGAKLQSV